MTTSWVGDFIMLFSSTVFIYLFLPFVLIGYFLIFRWSRFAQNLFLLAASLSFYSWDEPKFVFIMIASILVNWFFGLLIEELRGKKLCTFALILDVTFNLAILFVFKYLTFVGNEINHIFGWDLGTRYHE